MIVNKILLILYYVEKNYYLYINDEISKFDDPNLQDSLSKLRV